MRSMHSFMSIVFLKRSHIFLALLILSLFFIRCANMSHSTAVNPYNFKHVPSADKRSYVVMKDSSIVYGQKVRGWGDALLNKRVAHIDGKPIPASEVLGFQNEAGYFAHVENDALAKRYVTGRISVYKRFVDGANGTNYAITYFQKEGGPVKGATLDELIQMLKDCPKAYDMINIPREEYLKIVKKQPYYTQTVIETYNNCGEWQ